jgi:hypothetical protein
VLFAVLLALLVIILILQRGLVALGALSIKDSLGVLFSYHDLRAISLLDKLDRTKDSQEEEALINELHDTPSKLAMKGLLHRVKSPRFIIRIESLRAIGAMKYLTAEAEAALIDDVTSNPYTSAYYSARVLGSHKIEKAVPLLRELVFSDDYMLAGESMIALATIGDTDFRQRIELTIVRTNNPRLKLMGAEALGIYKSPKSLPVLFEIMLVENPPPYLRDETVLAMAAIIGIPAFYYKLLVRFLADQSMASTLALDEAESAFEYYRSALGHKASKRKNKQLEKVTEAAKSFQGLVQSYVNHDAECTVSLSQWILKMPQDICDPSIQLIFAEVILDENVNKYDRLRLLVIQWCARQLRVWTDKVKG